ncbi:MAG TPA: PTS sugar transporter subunit IIA [Acetobacteraceae bacterium]|nr:PTS sugar transporter subunit IIA [Acetobacteraceae bacterium]
MELASLIRPDRVLLGLRARDKAQALHALAAHAAAALDMDVGAILTPLVARERLGSTGLGRGFALPHARIERLDHFFSLFARLARPIPFEAVDGQPVDIFCLLLIPARPGDDHVAGLAAIARRMRDAATLAAIRSAPDAASIHALLVEA